MRGVLEIGDLENLRWAPQLGKGRSHKCFGPVTGRDITLQIVVLHKMQGKSCEFIMLEDAHALHPRDYGRLGERDDEVLARCPEDRVIVTENAVDFRKLVAREDIHPGLIILPNVTRDAPLMLLLAAIAHLEALGSAPDAIVNHVLEVDANSSVRLYPLP